MINRNLAAFRARAAPDATRRFISRTRRAGCRWNNTDSGARARDTTAGYIRMLRITLPLPQLVSRKRGSTLSRHNRNLVRDPPVAEERQPIKYTRCRRDRIRPSLLSDVSVRETGNRLLRKRTREVIPEYLARNLLDHKYRSRVSTKKLIASINEQSVNSFAAVSIFHLAFIFCENYVLYFPSPN